MENTLAIILNTTYSLSQLKHRLRILKSNLLKTFFGGDDEDFSAQDLDWLKSLPEGFYSQFNKDNVYEIFSKTEKELPKLNILTIYLTFEPDDATLAQIGSFSRQKFASPLLLLDTKVDPNLIAGAALVWKGIYKDYSLKNQIEARREEILQEFKRFLR